MSEKNKRSMEMLATALEMEDKGYKFYDQAVTKCQNDLGVKIFTMLRDDELIHTQRIQKIYEALAGGQPWTEEWKEMALGHRDLARVFRDLAQTHGKTITPTSGDLEALDVGVDFESKSVAYYEKHLEQATDPLEKEFVQHMIQEEKTHYTALADMKYFLEDPSAWFREQEGTSFDGGTGFA